MQTTDDPKVLWGQPQISVTHTVPTYPPDGSKRKPARFPKQDGTLIPQLWAEGQQGLGDLHSPSGFWQGPNAVSAPAP